MKRGFTAIYGCKDNGDWKSFVPLVFLWFKIIEAS